MSRPSKQGSHPGERKKTEPRARDLVKCGQVDDSVGTGAKSCEPPWKTVCSYPTMLILHLPYDPAAALVRMYSRGRKHMSTPRLTHQCS